jgi:hypothetical protein
MQVSGSSTLLAVWASAISINWLDGSLRVGGLTGVVNFRTVIRPTYFRFGSVEEIGGASHWQMNGSLSPHGAVTPIIRR